MDTERFAEVGPRAFELALHYVSAISEGRTEDYTETIGGDSVLGHEVQPLGYSDLPELATAALEVLRRGELTTLASRGRIDDLSRPAQAIIEKAAVLDAVVAGRWWLLATRLVWRAADFGVTKSAHDHERMVLAVDVPAEGLALYRLGTDDTSSATVWEECRHVLLREVVIRPAFEAGALTVSPLLTSAASPRSTRS